MKRKTNRSMNDRNETSYKLQIDSKQNLYRCSSVHFRENDDTFQDKILKLHISIMQRAILIFLIQRNKISQKCTFQSLVQRTVFRTTVKRLQILSKTQSKF